ncbi:MAG: ATP-binding protein, partial [Chitinophagaceae bacterium]
VKEAYSEIPKNAWETVSAFSNTAGGWLVFGIKKNGKQYEVIGIKNPEKIEQDFTTTLRGDKFNVKVIPECRKYDFPVGTILAFYIPLSDKKPVYFNNQANTFIRSASGDQRATKEEIDAMYRDQAFGIYTSKTIPGTSLKDISKSSYGRYREYLSHFSPSHPYNLLKQEDFLQKLRIISDGMLTYSGLLCLGAENKIQKEIPGFRIDYLEIPGTSYSDAKTRYTYRTDELENLWEYFFAIFDRLRRYLDLPFQLTTDGFATEDYPQLDALREGLVNLLMHSDYFNAACPRIRVFDDRVEFFNPGALPKPLEKLLEEDISMPRNQIIAKFFRVANLAENAGYGFDKMINGWKAYTGKPPVFDQGRDYMKVTFYFLKKKTLPKDHAGIKLGSSWDQVGIKLGLSISQAKSLLQFCIAPRTLAEIMTELKWNSRIKFTKKFITPTLENEFIQMTEPEKPKSPNQRYFTTDKGKVLLKEIAIDKA